MYTWPYSGCVLVWYAKQPACLPYATSPHLSCFATRSATSPRPRPRPRRDHPSPLTAFMRHRTPAHLRILSWPSEESCACRLSALATCLEPAAPLLFMSGTGGGRRDNSARVGKYHVIVFPHCLLLGRRVSKSFHSPCNSHTTLPVLA